MFCEFCGAELSENDEFCPVCGRKVDNKEAAAPQAPVNEEVPEESFEEVPAPPAAGTPAKPESSLAPEKPKKKKGKKIAIAALVVLGVLLIAAAVLAFLFKPWQKNKVNEQTMVYFAGRDLALDPVSDTADFFREHNCVVKYDSVKSSALLESDNKLYYTDGKTVTEIMPLNDVKECSFLGTSANFALLTTDGTLYYYEGNEGEKISEDGEFGTTAALGSSSANGKYFSFRKSDEDSLLVYVYDGKKIVEVGRNNQPVAFSSDGKYMYYVVGEKNQYALFVCRKMNTGKGTELFSDILELGDVYSNQNASEILVEASGKTYIITGDNAPVKLVSEVVYPLLPYGDEIVAPENTIPVVPVKSFKDHFFVGEESIFYLDSNYEMRKVCKRVNTLYAYVASDGKTLLYEDNEHCIIRIDGKKEGAVREIIVDGDSYGFVPTADGKTVYYLDQDDDLMVKKVGGKANMISDDQDIWEMKQEILFQGKTLYYIEDGELYQCSGGKASKVKNLTQDVEDYLCTKGCILINGEEEILYSKDGKKLTVLYEY